MLQLILSAIGTGIMISLILIGPAFFLLIETTISRGYKHALILDLGVILADILCICMAYFSSTDLLKIIDDHPAFYLVASSIIASYGFFMIISRPKKPSKGEKIVSENYFKTFVNGFLLNIVNIGVVVFWLITVVSIRSQYNQVGKFLLYVSIVMLTFFCLDLAKICLARRFHKKIKDSSIILVRRIVGSILIIFGIVLFLRSFGFMQSFDLKNETLKEDLSIPL